MKGVFSVELRGLDAQGILVSLTYNVDAIGRRDAIEKAVQKAKEGTIREFRFVLMDPWPKRSVVQ